MFREFLDEYRAGLLPVLEQIDAEAFGRITDILAEAYREDRQIFIAGNGGSAGTANHFVCDFGKNAVRDPGKRRFRMLSLCDNMEKLTAFGNDVSYDEVFRQQLINLMRPGDVLIAVSASGNSPNVVRACEYAREQGGKIVTLSGFSGGKICDYADVSMVAPLNSYEQVEDVHLVILHMLVCYFKNHPERLEA